MKTRTLSVLLIAAAFASTANAQPPVDTPSTPPPANVPLGNPEMFQPNWDGDAWRQVGIDAGRPVEAGLAALEAGDFDAAEAVFADIVRRNKRSAEANFYLGATRMDLGKFEDAKKHLEIAVKKMPRHPDPKSRLGVTYAKLGDTAGAQAQRAALVRMASACKGSCRLSPYIASGIEMIDEALAELPASRQGGSVLPS